MAKEFAKSFYRSKAWQVCRRAYISKRMTIDGGMCERCGEQPGHILHHKVKLTPTNINDPDITLNHCNLKYVCKDCHDKEHYADIHGEEKTACMFTDDGQPIPPIRDCDT